MLSTHSRRTKLSWSLWVRERSPELRNKKKIQPHITSEGKLQMCGCEGRCNHSTEMRDGVQMPLGSRLKVLIFSPLHPAALSPRHTLISVSLQKRENLQEKATR